MALGERGRNPLKPRSTAEGAASLRAAGALEPDSAVRCPDDMAAGFLGGFNITTLAKHRLTRPVLLRRVNQFCRGPTHTRSPAASSSTRSRSSEVDAGVDELVLLGAGLDSRPYRLADRLGGPRVFEVDHPASQATKRSRLRRLSVEQSRKVRFVPIDFTRDDLATEMARAGHDERAATLFIWSGVSPYLPEEAVRRSFPGSALTPPRGPRSSSTPSGRASSAARATSTAPASSSRRSQGRGTVALGHPGRRGQTRRSSASGLSRTDPRRGSRHRHVPDAYGRPRARPPLRLRRAPTCTAPRPVRHLDEAPVRRHARSPSEEQRDPGQCSLDSC